jgi:hypothetical protein
VPQLPVHSAGRNIEARPIAPLRDEAADKAKPMQNLLNTAAGITQELRKSQDVSEYNEFRSVLERRVSDIQNAALNDPDKGNIGRHLAELEKARGLVGNVKNPDLAKRGALEVDREIHIAKVKLNNIFQNKNILSTHIQLEETAQAFAKKKSFAMTQAESATIDEDFFSIIDRSVSSGAVSVAYGQKILNDFRQSSVDFDIMQDASVHPSESYVLDELLAGKSGRYAYLTDEERGKKVEQIQKKIKKNMAERTFRTTQQQDQMESQLLSAFGSDEVTPHQVQELLLNSSVRKDFGKKYQEAMFTPPPRTTDPRAYNKIKIAQLSGRPRKEINEMLAGSLGSIKADDRQKLIEGDFDPMDDKTLTAKASAQAIYEWAEELGEDPAEAAFRVFRKIENGLTPDNAALMVQELLIQRQYPDTVISGIPNIVASRNRIKKVYRRESKAKGKPAEISSAGVYQHTIGFDDL